MKALMLLDVVRYLLKPKVFETRVLMGVGNVAWQSRLTSGLKNIVNRTLIRLHKRIGVNNNFVILYKGCIDLLAL